MSDKDNRQEPGPDRLSAQRVANQVVKAAKSLANAIAGMSDDELMELIGNYLREQAVSCLNDALIVTGGNPVTTDDRSRPVTDFTSIDKLPDVLAVACRLADERKLTAPPDKPMDIAKVVTINDALWYILWQ